MKKVIHISSLSNLDKSAHEFLNLCRNRFFFAFYGELGAGKTTFIKTICKALGTNDNISSPTFSLVNEYLLNNQSGKASVIYHMDFYRLKDFAEALDIGVEEYFRKENTYCFIEWPEIVESLLPENTIKVRISKDEN